MNRASLAIVYATVFLDLLGFGIIIPQLPYYAMDFGATGVWVGAILTAYSAAQLIGAPVLGRLSDAYGRRPVLLFSLAGGALCMALTGLAEGLLLLLGARFLAGLFGGSISAAQAYIADVTGPEDRAKYMGLLGASIGMGFVFGPALGVAMVPWGFGAAAFVASGLAALNFCFATVKLKESLPPELRQKGGKSGSSWSRISAGLRLGGVRQLMFATFFLTFAFVVMETTFALLGEDNFSLDESDFGLVLTFVGVIMVVVQGGLVGRLSKKYGERSVAMVGALIMAVALAFLPSASSLLIALVFMGLLGVGHGLTSPTITTLLSRHAAADSQGSILGVGQSMGSGARALGPVLAGTLYDFSEWLPYLIAAGCMITTCLLVSRLRGPEVLQRAA